MQVPPRHSHSPVPPTPPPAIYEQASQDDVDRLFNQQEVYRVAKFVSETEERVAEAVQEKMKKRQDLSRELEEANDRLSYERSQPVIDRRKERSRDKRDR